MSQTSASMQRQNFDRAVSRHFNNIPLVGAEFVAEQGPGVHIVDVRTFEELSGPIGHIPHVTWVPLAEIAKIPEILGARAMVVIVSRTQDRAVRAAQYLEALGMKRVAAMSGGMLGWRQLGFAVTRDTAVNRLLPVEHADPGDASDVVDVAFVESHLASPRHVRWLKLAGFLLHGKRACVDGRDHTGVIGTPGGDTGEMIAVMAAIETVTGTRFDRPGIEAVIEAYTDAFGAFYMHTDATAMERLHASLQADPRLADVLDGVDTPHEWRSFLDAPPPACQPIVLEALMASAHIGCGHLRLSMENAEEYGVRPGLVGEFLSTWFMMLWAGAPDLDYVVLGGDHNERAVLDIQLDVADFQPFTKIPLVSPFAGGVQFFVNHPQVSDYLHEQTVRLLASLPEFALTRAAIPAVLAEVRRLAERQLAATLKHLATGLPIFSVRFDADRRFEVKAVGQVGS